MSEGRPEEHSFYKLLLKRYQEPPETDALFEVGQRVRVRKQVTQDGQTPKFWAGASAVIVRSGCAGLSKEWWYDLRHDNGAIDSFKEYEIDMRCVRK